MDSFSSSSLFFTLLSSLFPLPHSYPPNSHPFRNFSNPATPSPPLSLLLSLPLPLPFSPPSPLFPCLTVHFPPHHHFLLLYLFLLQCLFLVVYVLHLPFVHLIPSITTPLPSMYILPDSREEGAAVDAGE